MMMAPGLRKFMLTAHVTVSVGLLGSIAAFLALAIAGVSSREVPMMRDVYPAMALITRFAIVPLAFASLLSGVIQSLGTPWGLFRHYWILTKLLLTGFATVVLLMKVPLIGYAARRAAEMTAPDDDFHGVGIQLMVHSAGGLLMLLAPVVLSIYKPIGLTRYGSRAVQRQEKQRPAKAL